LQKKKYSLRPGLHGPLSFYKNLPHSFPTSISSAPLLPLARRRMSPLLLPATPPLPYFASLTAPKPNHFFRALLPLARRAPRPLLAAPLAPCSPCPSPLARRAPRPWLPPRSLHPPPAPVPHPRWQIKIGSWFGGRRLGRSWNRDDDIGKPSLSATSQRRLRLLLQVSRSSTPSSAFN
jgi:hypothetical protein